MTMENEIILPHVNSTAVVGKTPGTAYLLITLSQRQWVTNF